MTRTIHDVVRDARDALSRAGLAELDWTRAEVIGCRVTRTGIVVGSLAWDRDRARFACVNRSVGYGLSQVGAGWRSGLEAVFWTRVVIHPLYGFQVEIHDVDLSSARVRTKGASV